MPEFDPKKMTFEDLKHQPIVVMKTELADLAKVLGVSPAELFRNIAGVAEQCGCCGSDSW